MTTIYPSLATGGASQRPEGGASQKPEEGASQKPEGEVSQRPEEGASQRLEEGAWQRQALPLQALWDALRDVTDPEIPISIVDMGLVVDITAHEGIVDLKLTFTAMGCPAMEFIMDDIRTRLLQEAGVKEVRIDIVWDPVWTKARLSEEGIEILRTWGISA